jgi:hypothetical protein
MNRAVLLVAPVLVALAAAGCGGGSGPAAGGSVPWTGARALTAPEDSPGGVATDGTRVLFTTGRNMAGENAVRAARLDGDPVSVVVATSPGGQIPNGGLAIDGDMVYLAAGSGILRMPIAGGPATAVVSGRPAGVTDVVVAGADLWWTTYQYGEPNRIEVAHMPKAGGPVEVAAVGVAGGLDDPHPDGASALVASPIGVLRVRAGRPHEVVVSAEVAGGAVTHLAMDAERLYLLTAGSRQRLLAVPRAGGPPVELARDVDSTAGVVVTGGQVVFFAGRSGSSGRSVLQAVAGAGGEPRTIATGPYSFGDLAVAGAGQVVFSADGKVWAARVGS